jgi:glyoxylase-like metal-dependent hydrolase (beta-lactamase superfamily II)
MRITDEVYVVGGGPVLAFGLSNAPDCHVYLIDGGDELALVDCGMAAGDSLERIARNVEAEGLDLGRLRRLILTHYHVDHAGGAARFRERFGLEVLAPAGAAEALRTGDERAVALDVAKRAGFYDRDYRLEPVPIDRELNEGDRVRVGGLVLEVYDTPGHCDGHASYRLLGRSRRYLFAGDVVFYGGRVVLQNIHDCSIQRSAASVEKLAGLEFETLLPGHAAIAVDDGPYHVRKAAQAFNSLFVPKNLL